MSDPPDAYGRVTNPQRYAVLHDFARQLVDDLSEKYLVTPLTGGSVDQAVVPSDFVSEVVELSPPPGRGGPLAIAFTKFPGLIVRYGRWHHSSYPHCGCDACDESPEELAEQLRTSVEEFITSQVTERLRLWPRPSFLYKINGSWQWELLKRREARRLGKPERLDWTPWTLRSE
ncbi:MAG TPA: DUF6226 family protein [Acidimicrobiales bacterium]|nr:DUF6226 family protein [Acidimicrobiales bacterium]